MVDLQPILTKILKQDSFIKASSVKHRQVVYKKKHMYKDRKEITHVKKNIRHLIYILKKYNVCNKSGHKTMVHVTKNTSKPHYIP